MDIQKAIKIEGPKYGRCKCISDYVVANTDIIYRRGGSYFYEYHHVGKYYKIYLSDNRSSCNISSKVFNVNFKNTHEKSIKRASRTSKRVT
jgi:hypothetical protein